LFYEKKGKKGESAHCFRKKERKRWHSLVKKKGEASLGYKKKEKKKVDYQPIRTLVGGEGGRDRTSIISSIQSLLYKEEKSFQISGRKGSPQAFAVPNRTEGKKSLLETRRGGGQINRLRLGSAESLLRHADAVEPM